VPQKDNKHKKATQEDPPVSAQQKAWL